MFQGPRPTLQPAIQQKTALGTRGSLPLAVPIPRSAGCSPDTRRSSSLRTWGTLTAGTAPRPTPCVARWTWRRCRCYPGSRCRCARERQGRGKWTRTRTRTVGEEFRNGARGWRGERCSTRRYTDPQKWQEKMKRQDSRETASVKYCDSREASQGCPLGSAARLRVHSPAAALVCWNDPTARRLLAYDALRVGRSWTP